MISTLPKMSLVQAKIVLSEAYEMRYGIFNHVSPQGKQRPMASVAFFDCENVTERSPLYDAFIEFSENGYRDIWGYTLDQFLSLPQWRVKMLREVTQEVMAKRSLAIDDLKNGIGSKS